MKRTLTTAKKDKGKADILFAKIIRSRGACQHCGRTESLQCAHIMSRLYVNTRCDEANALCLCAKCHLFFTNNPVSFGMWVVTDIMSPEFYLELFHQAHQIKKVDWSAILAHLWVRAKELEVA